jgi:hypothetical protein
MKALAESQINDDCKFVAAALPVLQARAPTGNALGPALTLLLSSPTTPQVIGMIVSEAADGASVCANAAQGKTDTKSAVISTKTDIARKRYEKLIVFI